MSSCISKVWKIESKNPKMPEENVEEYVYYMYVQAQEYVDLAKPV